MSQVVTITSSSKRSLETPVTTSAAPKTFSHSSESITSQKSKNYSKRDKKAHKKFKWLSKDVNL